jgi:integrase
MSSPNRVPKYCKHRASGQAYVTLDGRDFYLGAHGSAASHAEYDRRIAEWIAAGRRVPVDPNAITVAEVVTNFRKHAKNYYKDADGTVSRSVLSFDEAVRPLLKLYAKTPAAEFGPLRLKAVREQMIAAKRVRTNINRHITRIRHVFKWAAENELIPASVFHGLMAVSGLRAGRCGAKEGEGVKPVPAEHVEAVLPFVGRQIGAMLRLQLLTGMRPGEVVLMRGADLDTTGKLWLFNLAKHKTRLFGHDRKIYLGPKAQEVVKPFLKLDPSAYLFNPIDAEAERREKLSQARKTPLSCGNKPGSNRRRAPKKSPGDRYTTMTYYRAVIRGCDAANPPPPGLTDAAEIDKWVKEHRFHLHQIRHTLATDLRKEYGIEGAQVVLGHRTLVAAQIYAEKNAEAAQRIMAAVG